MVKRIVNLSNLTLLTALVLSGIAAWYSILGLMAIFAAAVVPIIVMGGSLEVAKVVTTVWMHRYWDKINWKFKIYLVPAIIALAFLTSMGIFGFLSKAHSDQSLVSGDSIAKIAIIDEKIKISKEAIETNRKALKQLDEAVDQIMARSTDEKGADKSASIRKSQQKERSRILTEIEAEQKKILSYNEERAPLAAENRKLEAEVGPIKYIAALIYGDNPDSNLLERAVRWVIILIVFVFDPLALTLVIASNTSRQWEVVEEPQKLEKPTTESVDVKIDSLLKKQAEDILTPEPETKIETTNTESILDKHPYLLKKPNSYHPPGVDPSPPMVYKIEKNEEISNAPIEEQPINFEVTADTNTPAIETEGITKEYPVREIDNDYVSFEGKIIRKDALKEIKPEFFKLTAENADHPNANFGTSFPKIAKKGETFVRIDVVPNKVFKFDGVRWIEIVKSLSDTYLDNQEYIQFLISKLQTGEYDIDTFSDIERERIEEFLKTQNDEQQV